VSIEKLTKQEAIKRAKDGLDVWDDIFRYAMMGLEAIEPDDWERFKWYGLYRQRPKEAGLFMLRLKIPAGQLSSMQLRVIGQLAQRYSQNVADITTRQDIQLHRLAIGDIPDIFEVIYNKLGLYQQFSCGDAPRNVTGCPLAGIDANEIVDCRGWAASVSHMFKESGKEFSNLPRKLKVAVGGCGSHCHLPQINDIGFFGVVRERGGRCERGLGLMVGGGLRNTPHFAQSLRVFLPGDPELVRAICRHVAILFRGLDDLRHNRLHARLKFHMAAVGWRAFRDELEQSLGFTLEHDESVVFPAGACHGDHVGVGTQKNGLCYVGIATACGRLSGDDLVRLADLADRYVRAGTVRLATTIKQNIVLLDVPPDRVDDLTSELADAGLPAYGHPLRVGLVSCTGAEFCNLAIVETKQQSRVILDYLEERVALHEPLYIAVAGCPNSCAHYQVADIGLHGVKMTHQGQRITGFNVLLGAKIGADPQFGWYVETPGGGKFAVPAETVHESLARLLGAYKEDSGDSEGFASWARKQEMERLVALLNPESAHAGDTLSTVNVDIRSNGRS